MPYPMREMKGDLVLLYEIAICDDIVPMCNTIRKKLTELLLSRDIDIRIHTFTSGRELLKSDIVFDILFMDIELDRENGLEVVKDYPNRKETKIIFLTSHVEEMPNGYKVRAFRFLTKPIIQNEFEEATLSAIRDISEEKRFTATDEDGEHIIRSSEIIYVESMQRSTAVRTSKRTVRCGIPFEKKVSELNTLQFYRPHKSYIINLDFIDRIDKQVVVMKNMEKIKISRLKVNHFRDYFYQYVRSRMYGY